MAHLKNWKFPVKVLRVIDGDTVDLLCDLGLRVTTTMRARLYGIDTPEMNERNGSVSPGQLGHRPGLDAKMQLQRIIKEWRLNSTQMNSESWLIAEIHKNKNDSFGRWIVRLIGKDDVDLNRILVVDGYAKPADYGRDKSPYWGLT